ncbi:MAG: D-glycero-beta-D-manno-heptose 1-phosphate adenylyltransferase [Candidatus Schekmanbacteria bacterium]|nr:D-glycero-beta-D-manno-heptose 1-phosphate adenylyltransferase [Candidatus Schekmanbacteria bacterium]
MRILPHCDDFAVERARLRRAGRRLVFTNGCFDLLHVGHVRYLREARALGDCLLVAVNADETVRALKGPARPLNPLAARLEVLAALSCVDYVMPFFEETPTKVIAAIVPDVLVKGGDWPVHLIAGREIVEAAGGIVMSLSLSPGVSTTALISRAVAPNHSGPCS